MVEQREGHPACRESIAPAVFKDFCRVLFGSTNTTNVGKAERWLASVRCCVGARQVALLRRLK